MERNPAQPAATEGAGLAERAQEKKCMEEFQENQREGRLPEAWLGLHPEVRPSGYTGQTQEALLPQDSGKLRAGRAHNRGNG